MEDGAIYVCVAIIHCLRASRCERFKLGPLVDCVVETEATCNAADHIYNCAAIID